MRLSLKMAVLAGVVALAPSPSATKISSIKGAGYGNGFVGIWTDGTRPTVFFPDTAPISQPVTRKGFTSTGSATTFSENIIFTAPVRQAYNGAIVLTTDEVALSEYVYADDVMAGVTNNCTLSSPQPICQWTRVDQTLIGNSLVVEFTAVHRNARDGKQLACAIFSCTDGTTPLADITVSSMVVSTYGLNDQGAVLVYRAVFDTSGYPDDTILTVNARAYPRVGVASSVNNSANNGAAGGQGFVPLKFWKHTARYNAQPKVYVTATGVDATVDVNGQAAGITKVSTTDATAKANGFATVKSAMEALKAATNITGGILDGCRLRISNCSAGLASSTTTGTYSANKAAFVIEGDPTEAKASNIYTWASANVSFRVGYLRLEGNLTINRTNTFYWQGISGIIFGGPAGTPDWVQTGSDLYLSNSVSVGVYVEGLNVTATGGSVTFSANANAPVRLLRGVNGTGGQYEMQCIVGSKLSAVAGLTALSAARSSGAVVAFNRFMKVSGIFLSLNVTGTINGFANVQNIFEFTSATVNATLRPSGDGSSTNVTHYVEFNTTYAGANDAGRANLLYDETTGTYRSHVLCTRQGVCDVALNHKNDYFLYLTQPADAPLHTGTWSIAYGVGWRDIWTQYCSANGDVLNGRFSVIFPGLNGSIGTLNSAGGGSSAVPNDPKFVLPKCTTYNGSTYSPGLGDGDYHLQPSSPLRGRQSIGVLPFDLEGYIRSAANDTIGALAA